MLDLCRLRLPPPMARPAGPAADPAPGQTEAPAPCETSVGCLGEAGSLAWQPVAARWRSGLARTGGWWLASVALQGRPPPLPSALGAGAPRVGPSETPGARRPRWPPGCRPGARGSGRGPAGAAPPSQGANGEAAPRGGQRRAVASPSGAASPPNAAGPAPAADERGPAVRYGRCRRSAPNCGRPRWPTAPHAPPPGAADERARRRGGGAGTRPGTGGPGAARGSSPFFPVK